MKILRFVSRVLITPIFILSFGFFWIGFICFLGPIFQLFSFLEGNGEFSWSEHVEDSNEFFCEPLQAIWGGRAS